jgi:hypothetical protein
MALRHRSRHLRATLYNKTRADLDDLGWISAPVNFGATPITVIDYQPDERGEIVATNTVAVSIGDVTNDEDAELGAAVGGLRSAWYPVFIDVYMATQALTDAVCDDIRDIYDNDFFPLIDQITGQPCDGNDGRPAITIEIEEVIGPDRPTAGASIEAFKKYWRIMRLGCRVYYRYDPT